MIPEEVLTAVKLVLSQQKLEASGLDAAKRIFSLQRIVESAKHVGCFCSVAESVYAATNLIGRL